MEISRKECRLCRSLNNTGFKVFHLDFCRCRDCGLIFKILQKSIKDIHEDTRKYYGGSDYPSARVAESRKNLYLRFLKKAGRIDGTYKRILDVGCGQGYFVSLARQKGWQSCGIDLVPELVKQGILETGAELYAGDFEEMVFPRDSFDIITFWDVFDQLIEPDAVMNRVRQILKPGGLLYIRTQNAGFHVGSFYLIKFLSRVGLLQYCPRQSFIFHNINFKPSTIRWFLKKNEFSEVAVDNSPLVTGSPYRAGHGVVLLKSLYYVFAQLVSFLTGGRWLIGSSLEVWAKK